MPGCVTSDLVKRPYQHREGLIEGFSKDKGIKRFTGFEVHETMESAIIRTKRVKNWNRFWKINLVETENPHWRGLAMNFGFEIIASARLK